MEKSITVNGKDFTITPDKGEVLDNLIKSYPNQTAFTRAEIKEALDGYIEINNFKPGGLGQSKTIKAKKVIIKNGEKYFDDEELPRDK